MALTKTGDLLIRGSAGTGFEVLDAVADDHLAAFATFNDGADLRCERGRRSLATGDRQPRPSDG